MSTNEGKSKLIKLAANSHTYQKKAFKIYNKHHVDNPILFLRFFYLVKWRYEQFFTFFVGKVITFSETEIEQYVGRLKT